jgi:hypothetical protein
MMTKQSKANEAAQYRVHCIRACNCVWSHADRSSIISLFFTFFQITKDKLSSNLARLFPDLDHPLPKLPHSVYPSSCA